MDQELCVISQATEDRPGEGRMAKRHKDGGRKEMDTVNLMADPQKMDLLGREESSREARLDKQGCRGKIMC